MAESVQTQLQSTAVSCACNVCLNFGKNRFFLHARNMYHAYWDTLIRQLKPSPGVLDFMRELKKCGISIGVGTDMTAYIQYRKLEAIGASPYIDFIVTSEEAGVGKTASASF